MKSPDIQVHPSVQAVQKRLGWGVSLFIGGVIVGLTISKFSARMYYQAGLNEGLESVSTAKAALDDQRERVCVRWWFEDSRERLVAAKNWMCGRNLL